MASSVLDRRRNAKVVTRADEDEEDWEDEEDGEEHRGGEGCGSGPKYADGSTRGGGDDDDGAGEEVGIEEGERLWQRARRELSPEEDADHFLCDETGVLPALKHSVRRLLADSQGLLPPNVHHAMMLPLSGCADASDVWLLNDGKILARLDRELGFDQQSRATLGVMVARDCSSAWALPHVLLSMDKAGISEIMYELSQLPESLILSRINYQKVLDQPEVFTEHSGRRTEITGAQVFPAPEPGGATNTPTQQQQQQQWETNDASKVHMSTFLHGRCVFYSKTEGCLFPPKIQLQSHIAIRYCSLEMATARAAQIILLNALDLDDYVRGTAAAQGDAESANASNGDDGSCDEDWDTGADIMIVIVRKKHNGKLDGPGDRDGGEASVAARETEGTTRRERSMHRRRREERKEREKKQKSSVAVMNALQAEGDDSIVWSLRDIHAKPLEFSASVKSAFTLQFDVSIRAFVPLPSCGRVVEVEKLFVLHHHEISNCDNPLVALETAVFFDQKAAGFYGIHMYQGRIKQYRELMLQRQELADAARGSRTASGVSDAQSADVQFGGDVYSQLRESFANHDLRCALFDCAMLCMMKKTWRNIGYFRQNYRTFRNNKHARSLRRHYEMRQRHSSRESVDSDATMMNRGAVSFSPAIVESGGGRGAEQNMVLPLAYRLRFSQAAHLREVEEHVNHLQGFATVSRTVLLSSSAHTLPIRKAFSSHVDAVVRHAAQHLLHECNGSAAFLHGSQSTVRLLINSLDCDLVMTRECVRSGRRIPATLLDALVLSCRRLRNVCRAVSTTLCQGFLLRHEGILSRMAGMIDASEAFEDAVQVAGWSGFQHGSIADLAEVNRIRRLVPQSVAIAAVPFQYLSHHDIHDTLVRAQEVCLEPPYVTNPFPRVLDLLARKAIAFEHKRYRQQTLGQDFDELCEEDAQFTKHVNTIARIGSTFIHKASAETGEGNALHSVYGTYAAVSMCRPEYVHAVWMRLVQVFMGDSTSADAASNTKREGPFTIETINAFVGDLMISNVLCDADHVDKFILRGQLERTTRANANTRMDSGGGLRAHSSLSAAAVLHNVQVNVFRLIRVHGTSFLANREKLFAGEVADHIVALDSSPSIVVGHVNVGEERWTMAQLADQRRKFEAALAAAAMHERGDSSTQYWRSDLDSYIFANMSDDKGDRADRDGQAISVLIFCLQNDDFIPVRIEYVAYFTGSAETPSRRKVWSLFEIALLFPRQEDALLWHEWCCSSDEDHPLVAAADVDHADASLIARARECVAACDWLVATKLLLFRSAVVLDFTLLPHLVPCIQGPAQSLEGLHNDSLLFDAFDSTVSSSSSRMVHSCREMLLRFCSHAAVLLHHPSQCHFTGIRSPLLASLQKLQLAETDYSFDADTMDGILEIRDWSLMTARCSAKTLFDVYCRDGTRVSSTLYHENPFI